MASQFNLTAYLEEPAPWENNPAAIRGIVITISSIALLCTTSRLYIRLFVVRKPGWDDLFVGLYLATTLTTAITICIAPSFGLGQHLLFFTAEELRVFLILFYIGNATYISSTAFMKLSLLFQYLRIFDNDFFMRRVCQVLIAIVGLWGAAFSFMVWFPCFPLHKYWDGTPGGTCYGFGVSTDRTAIITHTAINMALDVFVLAIPVPLYLETSSPKRTRAGMLALLLLGCLVNVFAAWRLVLLVNSRNSPIETLFDATYYAPDTIILASLEVDLASICASVPIFWPVLRQQVFRILVTKEVEVTRGERYDFKLDSHSGDSPTSSRPASHRTGGGGNNDNNHLGFDNELVELPPAATAPAHKSKASSSSNNAHYGDSFIRDQVDPLRPGTSGGVETVVQSQTGKAKKKFWRRG